MTVTLPPWWAEREAYRRTRVAPAGLVPAERATVLGTWRSTVVPSPS